MWSITFVQAHHCMSVNSEPKQRVTPTACAGIGTYVPNMVVGKSHAAEKPHGL